MEIKKDYIKNIENAERRFVVSELESKHEVRSIDNEEEDEYIITGYAAKYNSETDLGYIREVIMPNAFDEVLQDDVRALLNHDESSILGRTKSGTLRIWADGIGLGYEVKLDKRNTDHMNTYYSIQRGDISQSSFASNSALRFKDSTVLLMPSTSAYSLSNFDCSSLFIARFSFAIVSERISNSFSA